LTTSAVQMGLLKPQWPVRAFAGYRVGVQESDALYRTVIAGDWRV
jgi:hypothetical protein